MPNPFPIKQSKSLKLKFDEQGSAYSNNYHDIYYQPGIGLDEKKHVFLKGNNLPNNWIGKANFTIAETGFGTGLNFLTTLEGWNNTKNNNQHLHYISCELHPLNQKQLQQALKNISILQQYTLILIERYPAQLIYGFHRIHFAEFNCSLTLIIGDCIDAFEQLDAKVDAWYLDGFGPSKNPDMWSKKLFKTIADRSHTQTTLATYTVAREIRNNLMEVGFEIKKTKGFGQKREMLTAKLIHPKKIVEKQPWTQGFKANRQQTFAVLGAGIAGLTIAHKLTQQDKNVTLIDRQSKPCMETSGNPQAMIMPSLTLNDSIEARFYLSAFLYAINYYSKNCYHKVGVHQLACNEKQRKWQNKLLTTFDLPDNLLHQFKNGLLYPQAGYLDTQSHAHYIYNQLNNHQQNNITKIQFHDQQWHLYQGDEIVHSSDVLVLANGINTKKLLEHPPINYELEVTAKHGQISYFNDRQITKNRHILLNKGYITPPMNGDQTIGATFDHMPAQDWYQKPKTTTDHWQRNIALWKDTPYHVKLANIQSHHSRAGIRVTTTDHLPICGAVIDQSQFKLDYADIRHGKHWITYPPPVAIDNLYLLTGLGSRGFTSAPILAESLCNQMLGQAQVLNQQMLTNINPNRFLYRSLKKN